MKKLLVVSSLLAVMLSGVTLAFANPPGPGYGPGYGRMHYQEQGGPGKLSNLTPEQKAKFQELRRKFRAENAQLIGSLVTKRMELQSLWTDPKADPKAIMDKERELRDLQNQMRDKGVQSRLEAREFLTPEQISQFGQHRGMGQGGMMGRGGMMGQGRGMGRMGRGMGCTGECN
jgi:Spy/CpxP family protein refolding chaperone